VAATVTLRKPKPTASHGGRGASGLRPQNMKLKRSLNSWLAILAAILLAVPAGRAQSADNPIPIRISAGESVTLERAAAKGEDVFELTARAGQTLALEEDGNWSTSAQFSPTDVPGLRVFPVDAGDTKDLPTPEGFGDCVDWR